MKNSLFVNFVLSLVLFNECTTMSNREGVGIPDKTNVLFIAIDDLNDWLGCYGNTMAITPNIDQLSREGVLFSNAHCQAPICSPSRTSLLTGLHPTSTGQYYFISKNLKHEDRLKDKITLPEYFSQNGYHTMGVGKISHNSAPELYDEYGGHGSAGPFVKDEKFSVPLDMGHRLYDWGTFPEHDSMMPDYKTTQWAIERLNRKYDKPFFLAVGFHRPHMPLYVPQKWFDMFPLDSVLLPEIKENDMDDISSYALDLTYCSNAPRFRWVAGNGQWRHLVQSYMACVSFVDHYVGEILETLKGSKYADNTIIVLWSDNGFHFGEKLRLGKYSLWERSTRVPLIFAGPGIQKDEVCYNQVGLIDIYPTLNELCGLPKKDGLEGESIVQLLKDPQLRWDRPAVSTLGPASHSVRTSQWRFILYGDGSMELYDREKDPNEWYNIADKEGSKAIIEELKIYIPKSSQPMIDGSFNSGTLTLYD